jgi:signal transduction histidine kinase/CheY-like chemotaxis protein
MEQQILRAQILPRGYSEEYEKEYRRKDGTIVPISLRVWLNRDAAGNPAGMWAIVRDITERKRAEAAVLAAKAEAEHANKAKDQFLAVLSHELRTPLTPVVMTVAAMEMDRTISPQLREDLAMIRRNIELETKLIDDLLDVTRIANGKLRLQARAADVHALLRNVLEMLKSDLSEKDLHVAVDLDAADDAVFADPARLQQVFWNLIKNAIKFTPLAGHVTVKSWNPSPRVVCVEVIDDGAGIEPSVLPRIFNAFDQGEQTITRQFGGLGLGLAISKALTELHGGTIRAQSDGKGAGARFIVELPTRTPVERIVDQIQPIGASADDKPRPRVLLVEDHVDTQRTLRRLLEDRGYEVLTAGSVAAALAVLAGANTPVDVLVSDIGLPDSTGYELMRAVRETYALPGVAVSGFGMDGDLKCSHDAGFAAHMTKPVDIQQLDLMIRSLLPARRDREHERTLRAEEEAPMPKSQ